MTATDKNQATSQIFLGELFKVEKILKGSLDSIPSPSPSKSLLTSPSNGLPLHLKQTFLPIIWIFTEVEGDGIKSRLPFKIFSTLNSSIFDFCKYK